MVFTFTVDKSVELVVWIVFFLWEFSSLKWKHIGQYNKKHQESLLSAISFSLEWMLGCALVIKGLGIAAIFLFLNYACDVDCGQWHFLAVYIMIIISVLLSKMHLPLFRMAHNSPMGNWMNLSSAWAAFWAFALNVAILGIMGAANTGEMHWLPFGLFFPYMMASLYALVILADWYGVVANVGIDLSVNAGVAGFRARMRNGRFGLFAGVQSSSSSSSNLKKN